MFIIDRYVLRLFFKVIAVSFASLTGLYVMIDSAGNLDELITFGKKQGSYLGVLLDYYGPRMLTFFDRMHGLLALLASMFVVTWLQRTQELTAIQAGGVSKGRVVRPLLIASVGVSLLGVANREILIPRLRPQLVRSLQDWIGPSKRTLSPRYDPATDIFMSGQKTIATEQTVLRPVFRLPRRLHRISRQLEAERAVYLPPDGDRPGGYLLDKVSRPEAIDEVPSAGVDDRTVVYTRREHEWLKPGQCFVRSGISFDQLSAGSMWQQFASSAELLSGLRDAGLNYGADARVTVHSRLLQPFTDLTLLLLGLPLVVSRQQRGIFVAIGNTAIVVSVFVTVVMASRALGANYLISPPLAAWLPLIVFVPLAAVLAPRFWD